MNDDLERELDETLHRVLDPLTGGRIPPRRPLKTHGAFRTLMSGAGAAFALKLAGGVVAAAAAVTVAGASTTGSLNPAVWGRQVSQQVDTCKSQLANGEHGIGDCVSSFASGHGSAIASAARHNGSAEGNGNGNGNAKSKDNGNGGGNGNGGNGHSNGKGNGHTPPGHSTSTAPPTFDPEPIDSVGGHAPVKVTPHP